MRIWILRSTRSDEDDTLRLFTNFQSGLLALHEIVEYSGAEEYDIAVGSETAEWQDSDDTVWLLEPRSTEA